MGRVKLNRRSNPPIAAILVVLATLASAVFGGCYWSRYPELMETHLVLLDEFAAKLDDVARSDRGVPVEAWPEFIYPLERARDFARIAAQRYPDHGSLKAFRVVLERYGALVDDPGLAGRPNAAAEIARRREALAEAIAETRSELDREAKA